MRLSTSSFSLRLGIFIGVLLVSFVFMEVYCRLSSRFSGMPFSYFNAIATADPSNAVFGDSHVGQVSYIPGYAFLGQAGQQPKELLLLVRSLYAHRHPIRVIVEASPQWVGEYHIGRRPLLTSGSLAPVKEIFGVRLLSLSGPYSAALFNNLLADLRSVPASIFSNARADFRRPDPGPFRLYAKEWESAASDPAFNWSEFPAEKRSLLTTGRVLDQNPIRDFETSQPQHTFAAAINFLVERGAEICLFRTPVTEEYLEISNKIPNSRFQAYDAYLKAFAGSNHIRLLDFRDLAFVFDNSKFVNADHLTAAAAKAMWPLVASQCFNTAARTNKQTAIDGAATK